MPLDTSTVGFETQPHEITYDWRTLATYALGVGAKREELPFLYENTEGSMKVLPSFGVVPAHAPVVEVLTKTGGDMSMIVHGAQTVRAHRPIPDSGKLVTTGSLKAIYDLKRFAQAIIETRTTFGGELAYETVWSIIFRGAGNFGGPRPTSDDAAPSVPKDQAPTWTLEERTSPEQALLYRISGDQNPLHADPAFAARVGFPQGPILHGLCTFGFLTRAVVKHACGGDPLRLRSISAQFRKPVWPGDTLKMSGFDLKDGRVALTTSVTERDEAVLGGAYAVIA
jgi:acyl dehydratase